MKSTKILLTTLMVLAFTTTANADSYKMKVCERAETAYWDAIAEADTNIDGGFAGSLEEKVQISYYKMALGKIESSITEVRKRCKGVASKDIVDAYEKKKSKIENKINSL